MESAGCCQAGKVACADHRILGPQRLSLERRFQIVDIGGQQRIRPTQQRMPMHGAVVIDNQVEIDDTVRKNAVAQARAIDQDRLNRCPVPYARGLGQGRDLRR